jgi:uncharacterized protein (TIGR03435 family)
MRLVLSSLIFLSSAAFAQALKTVAFDVASVKPSQNLVGPDYNNQFAFSPVGITGKNVTLKRLIAEAYEVQLNQVVGPSWLDRNEYEIEARTEESARKDQLALMLQNLLGERFSLKQHRETRSMSVYQLVIDKSGPKIRPSKDGEAPKAGTGFHFHGDLRQLADLLAVQLTIPESNDPDPARPHTAAGAPIPVLDKTGLSGIYDFTVDLKPEFGTGVFTVWQRVLQDQLGLRIESNRGDATVLVVDNAIQIPAAN